MIPVVTPEVVKPISNRRVAIMVIFAVLAALAITWLVCNEPGMTL